MPKSKPYLPSQRYQRGTLYQYESRGGLQWKGRFRVLLAPGKRKEVSITLGTVAEMSQPEARHKLDQIVAKSSREVGFAQHFGIRGTLKQFMSPVSQPAAINMRRGNIRGNIGAASELIVCADLVAKGFEIYKSVNPQSACDLLCMIGDQAVRIEVKTAIRGSGGEKTVCNLKNKQEKFDVLAVVSRDGRISYTPHQAIASEWCVLIGAAV